MLAPIQKATDHTHHYYLPEKVNFLCYFGLILLLTTCQGATSPEQNNAIADSTDTAADTSNVSAENAEPLLKPGHIVMQVSDLDRSQQFYEDHLKLETREEVIYEGERRIFMSASDSHHELVLLEPRKEEFLPIDIRQLQQLAFEVSSHEELVEYYQTIKATNIPYVIKDNQVSLSLYFPDPDSVTIELYWDIQDEPFGEQQWQGRQEDITEEEFLNPYERLEG
ncbi:VOC family protein [Catalinimonas sp. 4WD22]|uniref:VOC family protein n=1 Tax=Catalinimonas locisalis TaxID=3133978 RepID=UPI003100BD27